MDHCFRYCDHLRHCMCVIVNTGTIITISFFSYRQICPFREYCVCVRRKHYIWPFTGSRPDPKHISNSVNPDIPKPDLPEPLPDILRFFLFLIRRCRNLTHIERILSRCRIFFLYIFQCLFYFFIFKNHFPVSLRSVYFVFCCNKHF